MNRSAIIRFWLPVAIVCIAIVCYCAISLAMADFESMPRNSMQYFFLIHSDIIRGFPVKQVIGSPRYYYSADAGVLNGVFYASELSLNDFASLINDYMRQYELVQESTEEGAEEVIWRYGGASGMVQAVVKKEKAHYSVNICHWL